MEGKSISGIIILKSYARSCILSTLCLCICQMRLVVPGRKKIKGVFALVKNSPCFEFLKLYVGVVTTGFYLMGVLFCLLTMAGLNKWILYCNSLQN